VGNILVLMLLPFLLIYAIKRPWFGVMMYYLFSILQPKYIWHWIFPEDLSITKYLVLATFFGISLKVIKGEYSLSIFSNRQNIALIILFVLLYLSEIFSPYPGYFLSFNDSLILTTMNTIIAIYFLGQMCRPSINELKQMAFILAGIVTYFAYWANMQYISGEMFIFSSNGRLRGPFGSTYWDENGFSVVFITCIPFLAFLYFLTNKLWQKVAILTTLLACLHGLILIGSRGALVAFAVSAAYSMLFLIKTKKGNTRYGLIILLVTALGAIFIYQGGQLKSRTTETVARDSSQEEPIDPRIKAWKVGRDMIFDHPFLGVGIQRFRVAAATEYPGRTVNVAHNTFIQIAANSGVITGIIWLLLIYWSKNTFKIIREQIDSLQEELKPIYNYINNSIMAAMVGFFVVAIFLDLLIAEHFYCLLLIQLLLSRNIHTYNNTNKKTI